MKIITRPIVFVIAVFLVSCSSQYAIKEPTKSWSPADEETKTLIQQGVSAFDSNNFKEAISVFKQVLEKDSNCVEAMYELALTYSATSEHQKSLDLCYRAMDYQYPNLDQVYLLAGTTLDVMGKPKESVEVYEGAIERFPKDYMLRYNVGVTYLNLKEIEKSKNAFKTALHLNPSHSSSNLALATVLNSEGNYIPALFAYSRFLVLEPNSRRSESARSSIHKILGFGASKDPTKKDHINVTFNPNQPTNEGDFSSMSLFMSLNAALQLSKEQQAKSEKERLTDTYDKIIGFLYEISDQGKQESFTNTYYLPYYFEMKKQNFISSFVEYIYQSGNSDSTRAFLMWSKDFNWAAVAR